MADKYLKEDASGGYQLEDGSGVLLLDGSAYALAILADTPAAYWRMGESSGQPQDSAGTHHTTVTEGTPTYSQTGAISGDADTAILLDGSTEQFTVPDSAGLNFGNGPFSVELWASLGTDTAALRFMVFRGTNSYAVGLGTGDKFFLAKGGVAQIATESGTTTDTGVYHHFVATYNGTGSANTKIYKDGTDVTAYIGDQTIADPAGGTALAMGNSGSGGTSWYPGTLDEIAIYNYVLTPTQVTAHYNLGHPGAADTAPAEVATGTGAAVNASPKVSPSAGLAAATGAAYIPGTGRTPGLAAGTGAALVAAAAIGVSALLASGTGAAYNASVKVQPNAGVATATATAYDATTSSLAADTAPAEVAAGTGAAYTVSVSLKTQAGIGAGTGAAYGAAVKVSPTGGLAAATGAGLQPVAGVAPHAGLATGTGVALNVTATAKTGAQLAAGTGTAYDATVLVSGTTSAQAELATATGAAYNVTASLGPTAIVATGTGTSQQPAAGVGASPGVATGTGAAYDATSGQPPSGGIPPRVGADQAVPVARAEGGPPVLVASGIIPDSSGYQPEPPRGTATAPKP